MPRDIPLATLARRWGISPQRARELARQGRVPGAYKYGYGPRATWYAPADTPRPARMPAGRPRREEK